MNVPRRAGVGRLTSAWAALRASRIPLVVAVASGWFLMLGVRYVVPALLPTIRADFAINNTVAGLAITAIWAGYALMQFPAGIFVDRVGERRVLVASLAGTAFGVATLGYAPIFAALLVACGLFGLGSGLFGPPRGTVLARAFPQRGATVIGLTLAAGSVGAAGLPVLATWVAARGGWRLSFLLLAVPFALLAVVTWWVVPDSTHGDESPGSTGLRESVRRLLAAVSRGRVGVALLAATFVLFVFQGATAFLPSYLVAAKGFDQATAASVAGLLFVSGAIAQPLGGSLADRVGSRTVLVGVSAVSVLPLLALPFVSGLVPTAIVVALIGLRLALDGVLNAYVINALPAASRGTVWGFARTLFFLVGATGSMFVGVLADADYYDEAFLSLAVLMSFAAILFVRLPADPTVE